MPPFMNLPLTDQQDAPKPMNSSGRLLVERDCLVHYLPQNEAWRLPLADIRIIGEYTTNDGPYDDDYFFVFVTRHEWFEASFYAAGRDEVISALSSKLNHTLTTRLTFSTTSANCILWPKAMDGQPLFDYVPPNKARSLVGRLLQRVVPRTEMRFTEQTLQFLETASH